MRRSAGRGCPGGERNLFKSLRRREFIGKVVDGGGGVQPEFVVVVQDFFAEFFVAVEVHRDGDGDDGGDYEEFRGHGDDSEHSRRLCYSL